MKLETATALLSLAYIPETRENHQPGSIQGSKIRLKLIN